MSSNETEQEATMEDVSLPPPADFDLGAWISGVRATVRSVTLYQRGDLLGQIEEIERQLQIRGQAEENEEAGLNDTAGPEALVGQLDDLYDEFVASGVTFKVEGRSGDWMNEVRRRIKKDNPSMHDNQRGDLTTLTQVAGSIIEPEGVTVEMLRTLEEHSNAQYLRLVSALHAASSQPPAVSVPTSRTSSGGSSGRR